MSTQIDRVATVALTVAALAMAAALVKKEFFPPVALRRADGVSAPVRVSNWSELLSTAVEQPRRDSAVQIVIFSDLECPFCRALHGSVQRLVAKHGDRVRELFIHFPLDQHRFARPAALAAECAERVGNFAAFVDVAYAKQDSFGLKPWSEYAKEAGVSDLPGFERCRAQSEGVSRIDAGKALGTRMGIHATPTVVIDGWKFAGPPAESVLVRFVDDLVSKRRSSQ